MEYVSNALDAASAIAGTCPMKRHALDAEIARLEQRIPTLKPRTHEYIRDLATLQYLRHQRMMRDRRAGKRRTRNKEIAA